MSSASSMAPTFSDTKPQSAWVTPSGLSMAMRTNRALPPPLTSTSTSSRPSDCATRCAISSIFAATIATTSRIVPDLPPPTKKWAFAHRIGSTTQTTVYRVYGNCGRAEYGGVRDTKVDAEAIHQQNGLNPSVCVRKAAGAFVGQLGKLRPIVNRPDAALAPDGGGSQPPRRLPACPTSRQRFHFYVVHPNLLRNWQNGKLWWNDPDAVTLSGAMPMEEYRFHAGAIMASGGLVISGDDLSTLPADRLAMLKKLLPPTGVAAEFADENLTVGAVKLRDRTLLCVFNWSDEAAKIPVKLARSGEVSD